MRCVKLLSLQSFTLILCFKSKLCCDSSLSCMLWCTANNALTTPLSVNPYGQNECENMLNAGKVSGHRCTLSGRSYKIFRAENAAGCPWKDGVLTDRQSLRWRSHTPLHPWSLRDGGEPLGRVMRLVPHANAEGIKVIFKHRRASLKQKPIRLGDHRCTSPHLHQGGAGVWSLENCCSWAWKGSLTVRIFDAFLLFYLFLM